MLPEIWKNEEKVVTLRENKYNTMATKKYISEQVLRLLYAHSGNKCAFPECHLPIFEDNGVLTGECCHIKARSVCGPRYDPNQTDEERNGVENLILLCSRHHKIIDTKVSEYPVEALQRIKANHEAQFKAHNLELSCIQIKNLQQSSLCFWKNIEQIDRDTILPDLKMKVDSSISLEDLICKLDSKIEDISLVLDNIIDSDRKLLQSIQEILPELGIELDAFNEMLIEKQNSDLFRHNWEMCNLAAPNTKNALRMLFLQLVVRILEDISFNNNNEHPLLSQYRMRLAEFQKENYYID
jgi:hypothetical protein